MKLLDARASYYELSGKLSEVNRQLCFAGIAVVWIFRASQENGGIRYEPVLMWPLACFVSSLGFDLLHYIWGTLVWGWFSRRQEQAGKKDDDDVFPSAWINRPTLAFFWAKVLLAIAGFISLASFLWSRI